KLGTRMSEAPEPSLADHAWTIAVARIVLGPAMNIHAPPNLQPDGLAELVRAGINDWGGVSPVTPDHVNPEAPWPHLAQLERATEAAGRTLVERLAIYPEFVPVIPAAGVRPRAGIQGPRNSRVAPDPGYFADAKFRDDSSGWIDAALVTPLLRHVDAAGLAREDAWAPGGEEPLPLPLVARLRGSDPSPQPSQAHGNAGGEGSDPRAASPGIARIL